MGRSDLLYTNAAHMTNFADASFNTDVGIEVFEYIEPLRQVFSEIYRVLLAGGRCYMSVPFVLFRGKQALSDAWAVYRDLRRARRPRRPHVHLLSPARIKEMTAHTSLSLVHPA